MKMTLITCVLLFTINNELFICPKVLPFSTSTTLDNLSTCSFDTIQSINDSTRINNLPSWLINTIMMNDYINNIRDTSLYTKYIPKNLFSSHLPQERYGVCYARKIESLFHDISPASTITKNGHFYILTSEDMENIYILYRLWWEKVLSCNNLNDLVKSIAVHPFINSPYVWEVDTNAL